MALVKVEWTEVKYYEADVEVDGWDAAAGKQPLRDAIGELSSEAMLAAERDSDEGIEIRDVEVLRAGDEPIAVIAPRKVYEADF